MKSLDLKQIGLQELNLTQKLEVEGGSFWWVEIWDPAFFWDISDSSLLPDEQIYA